MKSGNKKHNVRIAALIAAVLALCLALTGCMMGSGKQPSINAEDDSTVAYADRQLTFAQNRHAETGQFARRKPHAHQSR